MEPLSVGALEEEGCKGGEIGRGKNDKKRRVRWSSSKYGLYEMIILLLSRKDKIATENDNM